MSELKVAERPELRRPVLVAAFRGWNDGGQGASLGAAYLAKHWEATRFAEIDPESFYDFQAVRPHVSLADGQTRKIDWPDNAFFHARIPGSGRDAVLLLGLVAELSLEPSRYEGPTGIVGVVHDACREAGIPSVSLWAAVPHYVSLAPSPRAALSLVRRFGELLDVDVDVQELEQAAEEYSEQVSEAVSTDADTAAYVAELEQRVDELVDEEGEIPSGETLAAELTRFLRERDEQDDSGAGGAEGPAA